MAEYIEGPWTLDPHTGLIIYALGNQMRIADVRGWGYLTGKGHGALGLPHYQARAIQQANAALIASAPALKAENERLREALRLIANDANTGSRDFDTNGAGLRGSLSRLEAIARAALGEKSDD